MSNQDNLNFDGNEWIKDAYFVKTQQDIDFIAALDKEDYEKAEQLIKEGANINVCMKEGKTITGVYLSLAVDRSEYCKDELETTGFDNLRDKKYKKYKRQHDFLEKHGGKSWTEESLQIRDNYLESFGDGPFERIANDAEFETPVTRQMASNYSILGQLRKFIAECTDIVLGTHLEDVRLPTSFKERVEKPISDKVLGKLKVRDSKAPRMKFNPTSMEFEYANPKFQEIAERRRELNHTNQDILALKERIAKQGLEEIGLEGKMGQTGNSRATNPNEAVTETHKKVAESQIEDLKPFIKNYLEQRRSK